MKVKYSEQAVKDLETFNAVDRQLIVKKIHYLAENFQQLKKSKKVTQLKGTKYPDQYRYVIAKKIRAIFRVENNELILLVLRIGLRKNIYE
ncbi:MAG TPA: type II toxin-antitoxin system RelE/ParE family toxin [Spirochaetota bacterium]|nr:type II toxin-antitoxin system RelE/ParE family toxin [Spirochaetota bacterium]HOJ30329.1 type II toxin-antitoxin system RelE/ParE family toxin [Spirochaetota bacterium]HOM11421.1 type II toxin-antitoxin system RelE/ParE family toxin [Spirochaetota bacterium]HPP51259.1 type II toxin-antitoxin system RelE/ParE family toxin [Spirochaetota bacterium]